MGKQKQSKVTSKNKKDFLVISKRREDYELFDIRSNKPIYYYSNPLDDESGSLVAQELDKIEFPNKINGKKNAIEYFAPNSVGLLLSISAKSLMEAKKIYEGSINPVNDSDVDETTNRMNSIIEKSKLVYDYIELIQTSIVFGYTALETFVNLSIPDDYQYKTDVNSKGIVEIYDKEAIERWLQLRSKLSDILVSIYKTKSIKQLQIWTKYIQFEDHRNEIIHQKSINQTNFYKKYFNKSIFELCKAPEQLINFFFEEREQKGQTNPLWPWIINTTNDFPGRLYNPEDFQVTGNIYEGRTLK